MSELSEKTIKMTGNGFLKIKSSINKLSSPLGVFTITRNLYPNTLNALLVTLTAVTLFNVILIFKARSISSLACNKNIQGSNIFLRPFVIKLIRIFFNYYDIIFPVCLIIACGTASCRWVEVEQIGLEVDNVIKTAVD